MIPFVTTPYVTQKYGWSHFAGMWRQKRGYILAGGALGLVAYLLALFAYSFAPLSYSGAIREVSAVIGAFLGWKFLNEQLGGIRVVGAAIVFAGVLVIAIFG
jgi:drug/metabolite transporter (DMT)-like permease